MKNILELNKEEKETSIEDIKKFFLKEKDEEIGSLASSILLDFIIEKIAPAFYNQGIQDAITYMSEKVEDMYGLEIFNNTKKPQN